MHNLLNVSWNSKFAHLIVLLSACCFISYQLGNLFTAINFSAICNNVIKRIFTSEQLLVIYESLRNRLVLGIYQKNRNLLNFFQKYFLYLQEECLYILDCIYVSTLGTSYFENESREKRAIKWVEVYTAITTLLVFSVCNIPGATTAILLLFEGIMFYHLRKILYKQDWTWKGIWKVIDSILLKIISFPILIGNIAALETAVIVGNEAFAIKPAIAASIVRTTGVLLFRILEEMGRAKTNGRSIAFSK